MDSFVMIVPRLPPVVDGIGDYALNLARELRNEDGIETSFIIGDPAWSGPETVEGFSVFGIAARDAGTMLELLPRGARETILLHYGGYGYARRGCPVWLVEALRRWRGGGKGRSLLTMFHELYANGPMWTSSFWLSPVQRGLAARLARLSDGCLTSLQEYADRLVGLSGGALAHASSLPVFSSVGEPTGLPPSLSQRRRRLVVFGTRGRRLEVYRRSATHLRDACRALQIEEVCDIGRLLEPGTIPELGASFVPYGELPGGGVSEVLSDSVAGVIDYPAHMLGKSTIFAAYCAHRLLPIVAAHGAASAADGLRPGREYLLLGAGLPAGAGGEEQKVADRAYEWYQSHTLSAHARALSPYFSGLKHGRVSKGGAGA